MLFISSRAHGLWDYLVSILLIAMPYMLGFAGYNWATYAFVIVGAAIFGLSLMTNYEFSLVRIVPLRVHLIADMGAAVFLAASPWIFGFWETLYLPHVVMGAIEFLVASMTVRVPFTAEQNGKDVMHHARPASSVR